VIFCIYGPSCVGKTTVAREVATQLDLPLHSCGDKVRQMARGLGVSLDALSDDSHRQIDRDTVAWALDHRPCVIEGRFLDAVFADSTAFATLIFLGASDDPRIVRGRNKDPSFTFAHLRQVDAHDASFRARVYGSLNNIAPYITIDTSQLTVDECARRIAVAIEQATRAGQRG
jgi:cytidylate kinase